MSIKRVITETLANCWAYRKNYLKSIFLLQGLRVLLALPVISWLFIRLLKASELQGITETTFKQALSSPMAIFFLVVLVIVSLFFIYYELGYFFILAHFQKQDGALSLKKISSKLNKKIGFFFSFQLVFFLLYFILILPIAAIGLNASLTENLRIPHFITDELLKSTNGRLLYGAALLLLFYIGLRFIYTIPFFVIESEMTIGQSLKKSWQFSKGKLIKTMAVLGGLVLFHSMLTGLVLAVLALPLLATQSIFPNIAPVLAGLTVTLSQLFLFFWFGFLEVFLSEAVLQLIDDQQEITNPVQGNHDFLFLKIKKNWAVIFGSLLVISLSIMNVFSIYRVVYQPQTLVIAHRGYTVEGIENTITSLNSAAQVGADFVEMDIQETKDHQFVVFHDYTLRRLAGRSDAIADMTLAEIQEVELRDNGFTDYAPSLEEYIAAAKEADIKLLIEIKTHGKESADMEKRLVELLQKEKVTSDYLVQSLTASSLTEIKKLDPEIRTGYLVALNIGNLPVIDADFLVLEEFSFNKRLLSQARAQDKTVFVWTINRENLMRKYFSQNIDGMITNYPKDAIRIRQSFEEEQTLTQRIRELIKRF